MESTVDNKCTNIPPPYISFSFTSVNAKCYKRIINYCECTANTFSFEWFRFHVMVRLLKHEGKDRYKFQKQNLKYIAN